MSTMLTLFLLTLCIITCKSLIACASGECVIDCDVEQCDIVICTNYASSCLITCSNGQCKDSQFYLAARKYNTVYCTGNTACNEINIQCGEPDLPPIGYSEYDFISRYNSLLKCNFVSKPREYIAANPTNQPTMPPTLRPTNDPIQTYTNNKQMAIQSKSHPDMNKDSSVFGMEFLIVTGVIGLLCVVFTICFCVCMGFDFNKKMAILTKQNEDRIAVMSPSPPINIAVTSPAIHITGNINKVFNKNTIAISDRSNGCSNSNCNMNSNAASKSTIRSVDIASADVSSMYMPCVSLTPIESQKSGYIVTGPMQELKIFSHTHDPMESEPNLDTKISISPIPNVLNRFNDNYKRASHTYTFNSMNGSNGTVVRKATGNTEVTMSTANGQPAESEACTNKHNHNDTACQLSEFSDMLVDEQNCVVQNKMYHD